MTIPAGQSCATCSFYVNLSCRAKLPEQVNGQPEWPPVSDTDWCGFWNCWPGRQLLASSSLGAGNNILPTGGNDGDYYIFYIAAYTAPNYYLTALRFYQKQAGVWVVINTIL